MYPIQGHVRYSPFTFFDCLGLTDQVEQLSHLPPNHTRCQEEGNRRRGCQAQPTRDAQGQGRFRQGINRRYRDLPIQKVRRRLH